MKKYKIDIEANVTGSDDLEKLDQSLESIDDNAKKATTGLNKLDKELDSLSTSADNASDSIDDVGDSSKDTSTEMKKMGSTATSTGKQVSTSTKTMGAGYERLQDNAQLAATSLKNIAIESKTAEVGVRAAGSGAASSLRTMGTEGEAAAQQVSKSFKVTQEDMSLIKKEIAGSADELRHLLKTGQIDADEFEASMQNLLRTWIDLKNNAVQLEFDFPDEEIEDAAKSAEKLSNEMDEAADSAARMSKKNEDMSKSSKKSEGWFKRQGLAITAAFGGAVFALVNRVVDALINIPPVTEALEKAFKGITTTVEAMTGKWDDLYESVTNTEAGFWDFINVAREAIKAMKDLQYQMVINESLTASNARAVAALNDNAERTTKIWQDETLELGKRTTALNQWKVAQLEAIKLEKQAVDRQLAIKQRELLFTGLIKEREELEQSIDYWQNYYDAAGIVDDPNARPILAGLLERLQEMEVIMGPINTEIQSLLLAQDDLNRRARDVKEEDLTISPITDDGIVDNDLESWKRYNLQRLLLEQEFNEKINLLNQDDELGRLDVQEEFLIRAKKLKENFLKSELYILELRGLKYTEEYEKLSDELLDVERDYTVEFINIQNARAAEEARLRAEKLEEEQQLLEEQKRLAQEEFDYRRMLFGEMINLMGEIGLERIGIFADMMDILWVEAVEDGVSSIMKLTELSTAEIGALIGTAFRGVAQLMNFIADAFDESTREGFEKQKKARIGGAIMDSFGAAIAGLLAGLEAGGPWGIALGIATAASSLAFGLVQVDKIRKTTFDGGGDSGGGGIGPQSSIISPYEDGGKKSSPADPNVLKQGAGNLPPVQAQVVGETVTTQQAIERQTTKNASF